LKLKFLFVNVTVTPSMENKPAHWDKRIKIAGSQ